MRKHTLYIIGVSIVLFFLVAGYMLGVYGVSVIQQAQAFSNEASALYKQSNALYDQSQAKACKAYGLIVADCYAGTKAACPMMATLKDAFNANYEHEPFDVCGL